MKSPLSVSMDPVQATLGSPVVVSLRVANRSDGVLDSVSLGVRIPGGATCLRGDLRMEVPRLQPGAMVEIPLVVEFGAEGSQEFRVQAGGRAFDGPFRAVETTTVRVQRGPVAGDIAPGDAGLACDARLRREEAEYRVEVLLTGPPRSIVDGVQVGDRPLHPGHRLPSGVPMRIEFRVAVPMQDTVVRLGIAYRDPGGVRRQLDRTVAVPGASRRALLFVAANPSGMAGIRDHGGLKGGIPGATAGEVDWIPSDLEFEMLSRVVEGSALVHLATPCLAASYQGLLRHLLRVRPRWVHFAGHGNERHLVLHGSGEVPLPVPGAAIEEALRALDRPLDLLVLNACHSASVARDLRRMARFRIATLGPVSNTAALRFSEAFYTALLAEAVPDRDAIHRAFLAGRGAVRAVGIDPEVYDLQE